MKRTQNSLDSKQVLSVIEKYSTALDLLDAYDHQNMERPKGNEASYVLTYLPNIRRKGSAFIIFCHKKS